MATEEFEVNVRQIGEPTKPSQSSSTQTLEVLRKLMLAGIGALALSREEAEGFVNRLAERGELAQKDAQKLIEETSARFRKAASAQEAPVQNNIANIGAQVENSLQQFLNRLSIPSKHDIDDLSTKIANLTARIEELRRNQETGSTPPSDGTKSL